MSSALKVSLIKGRTTERTLLILPLKKQKSMTRGSIIKIAIAIQVVRHSIKLRQPERSDGGADYFYGRNSSAIKVRLTIAVLSLVRYTFSPEILPSQGWLYSTSLGTAICLQNRRRPRSNSECHLHTPKILN